LNPAAPRVSQFAMNKKLPMLAWSLLAAGLLLVVARGASSAELVEGKQYKLLKPAQPSEAAPGKVGVTAVFWYACGHCYLLEPKLEAWNQKGRAPYVQLIRLPATWNPVVKNHARVFYTLELLGKPQLHDEAFREINVKGNRMDTPEKIEAFFVAHGVSKSDFQKAFSSFAVESKILHAEDLNRRYKITGTPTIVVNGKYITDVSMAGGEDQLLQVVNELAAREKPSR
jgi:protein dithiol oxidoreductase (disulfide-forming)